MDVVVMALDSMHVHNFCRQTVVVVKMLLFLELKIVFLRIFIIKKDILALGEGSTQGLVNTTITT